MIAPFVQPAAADGVEPDAIVANPKTKAAGIRMALMIYTFQRFRDTCN
jgi:hypothetical protein